MTQNDSDDLKDLIPYETQTNLVSPEILQAFLEKAPNEAIQLVKEYTQQQTDYEKAKRESYDKQKISEETTKRIGLGFLFLTIISVLVYSAITQDPVLSGQIINITTGAFGGIGLSAAGLLNNKKD